MSAPNGWSSKPTVASIYPAAYVGVTTVFQMATDASTMMMFLTTRANGED